MNDTQATQAGWWTGLVAVLLGFRATIEYWIMRLLWDLSFFPICSIFSFHELVMYTLSIFIGFLLIFDL